jgi:hypothetical protein
MDRLSDAKAPMGAGVRAAAPAARSPRGGGTAVQSVTLLRDRYSRSWHSGWRAIQPAK